MKFKRFLSLFICAVITLTFFSACSEGVPELLSFIPEVEPEVDFGGKEFKIIGYYREGVAEIAPINFEAEYSDMLLEHYKTVGNKFNLNIVAQGSTTISDDVQINASVGDKYADIIDSNLITALDLYNAGFILNVDSVIDPSELYSGKYGTRERLQSSTLRRKTGDIVFAFQAAYWGIPSPKFANAGCFNPDLISTFNLENPYELIENGNWTWDRFESMCIACSSDGLDSTSSNDDIYGVAEDSSWGHVTKSALASNDVDIVLYNEETGAYELDLDTPKSREALEWVKNLYDQGGLRVISGSTENSYVRNVVNNFIEGRSLFLVEHTYHGTSDRESVAYRANFDFSWIPFPKGPSATNYNYNAAVHSTDRYFAFPSVAADEDMLTTVVPELFSPFDGLSEDKWRDYFSIGMFFSEDSQEWFFHMFDNVINNYDYILSFFTDTQYLSKIITGDKTVSQALESYKPIGQKELDENLNVK